jgi:hypothetical protein
MPARHFIAAGAVALVCFSATPQAAAAETVEAPTCSAVVDGAPGQEVVLAPQSVADTLAGVLAGLDPLGVLTEPFRTAWNSSGPIHLGTISAGETEISGSQVADAVAARLGEIPLLGPVLGQLMSTVRGVLDAVCGLLLRGVTPAAPGSPGAPASPVQPGSPVTPPVPGSFDQNPGSADLIGTARGTVFGERLPGAFLSDTVSGLNTASFSTAAVPRPGSVVATERSALARLPQAAGSASTLQAAPDPLSQPVLLAMLALTIVSAQLVRRLALRPSRR